MPSPIEVLPWWYWVVLGALCLLLAALQLLIDRPSAKHKTGYL